MSQEAPIARGRGVSLDQVGRWERTVRVIFRYRRTTLWLIAAIMAFAIGAKDATASHTSSGSGGRNGPAASGHSDIACTNCHFARKVRPGNADRLTGDQDRLCGQCHKGVVEASHPIGFVPARSLPPGYPLNERGEMSCSTCHDVHETARGRLRSAERGRAFCMRCHPADFFAAMADSGGSLDLSGHLSADARPGGPVDAYSMQCMACHADSALVAETRTASLGFTPAMGGGGKNHPIGSDYDRLSASRDYRPRAALPARMLLPEGRVSCLSCHEGYSRRHGKLVSADNLCTHCHNK